MVLPSAASFQLDLSLELAALSQGLPSVSGGAFISVSVPFCDE